MACHNEVLEAAKAVLKAKKGNEFTIKEIRVRMVEKGSRYTGNTIRGQIVSACNIDSPKHRWPYFRKVKNRRATYTLA